MKEEGRKSGWVDVHDEALMVRLGIHPPQYAGRDPEVWTKTDAERKRLARERRKHKERMHMGVKPLVETPIMGRLIVYLKPNGAFRNSTHSTRCMMHAIPSVLAMYRDVGNKGSYVAKYVFNGRTYAPGELPFWYR